MAALRKMLRRKFSSVELIVTISLFVAVVGNLAFFSRAINVYGGSPTDIAFIVSLFVYITCIFIIFLSLLAHQKFVKPTLIAFLLLSSIIAYYSDSYGTIFDYRMIENILETNSSEALDVLSFKLGFYVVLLSVVPSLILYRCRHDLLDWRNETIQRIKILAISGLLLGLVTVGFTGHFTSFKHEHHEIEGLTNPTYALSSVLKYVKREYFSKPYPHLVVGADAKVSASDSHRELVIMVVGETVRADHFSLNGYSRKTNPLLEQQSIINFPNFWSCDTSTAKSVPCMFSHYERKEFDRRKAKAADNVLDILKNSGVSVLWRDNNSNSKGVAAHVAYEDFRTPNNNPVCDHIECRDEGMLSGLQDYINKQDGDVFVVLHQLGNHGPAYYKRYPDRFEAFKPVCKSNDLGSCEPDEIRNAYDNAILYTDFFLTEVIKLLKKNDGNFETALMYVSDHGESLGEYGLYLHATPYALAPDAQKHVPFLLWLGDAIKHDVLLDDIEERRLMKWSHDNIFATLLGLFEIKSDVYRADMDLLTHSQN